MATYKHELQLSTSEAIMLEEALSERLIFYKKQVEEGKGAPYYSHMKSAESVLKKLEEGKVKSSESKV